MEAERFEKGMFKIEPVENLIAQLEQIKRKGGEEIALEQNPDGLRPNSPPKPQPVRPPLISSLDDGPRSRPCAPRRGRMRLRGALANSPSASSISPRNARRASSRHSRKCAVCNHPQRDEIEHRFLRWHCHAQIAQDFNLYDRQTLHRHAKATGLIHRRGRNLAAALGHYLEQGSFTPVTASAFINAVKTYAILENQWTEPPRRVIVTHIQEAPFAKSTRSAAKPRQPNPRAAQHSQDPSGELPAFGLQFSEPNRHTPAIKNRRKSLKTKGGRSF